MSVRSEHAAQLFMEGYNCSQAVVGAFADCIPIEFDLLMKMSSSMGGGMGRLREVCGAVSGMFLVAGFFKGYSDPKAREEKTEHYRLIQALAQEFKNQNGSIICRELLGGQAGENTHIPAERTQGYYQKRPCKDLVSDAVCVLERVLNL